MTQLTSLELEEILEQLDDYRGKNTELITVYIPEGYDVNSVQKQLESEKGTAKNIKSTATRKNVSDALDKIVRHLKTLKKTPKNGLAIFCGNTSDVAGQQDLQLWDLEPYLPVKVRLYRCDKEFVLDPLKEMLAVKEIFGLLVMDRKEATIGVLEGKRIEKLQHLTSGVPSKVRAGGQCIDPETLIMRNDGEIIEIKDSHNPLIVVSENFNAEKVEETPIIAKWENKKELYRVTTSYPRFEISSSMDHTFFVRTSDGIQEKSLKEIKEGDYLLLPEKIDLDLGDQAIQFTPSVKQSFNMKEVSIPLAMNPSFAKVLGYYLGDGSYEIDRLTFFEQNEEVALFYQRLIKDLFGISSDLRFRRAKNYWQLRI